MKLKVLITLLIAGLSAFTASAQDSDAIKERIKPIGQVHIAGAQAASADAGGPRSGADVYTASCVACHAAGVLGAPKPGSKDDWAPRLDNGMETLVSNAINGINAMPPRGTCATCSDDEIKAAIEHMLEGI